MSRFLDVSCLSKVPFVFLIGKVPLRFDSPWPWKWLSTVWFISIHILNRRRQPQGSRQKLIWLFLPLYPPTVDSSKMGWYSDSQRIDHLGDTVTIWESRSSKIKVVDNQSNLGEIFLPFPFCPLANHLVKPKKYRVFFQKISNHSSLSWWKHWKRGTKYKESCPQRKKSTH